MKHLFQFGGFGLAAWSIWGADGLTYVLVMVSLMMTNLAGFLDGRSKHEQN